MSETTKTKCQVNEGEVHQVMWPCKGCKEHNHIDQNGEFEECVCFGKALPTNAKWCRHRNPHIPLKLL